MRSRRRRSKSVWNYAQIEALSLGPGDANAFTWLYPPARTNYICNADRVDSLLYTGSLLWLDFRWQASGPGIALNDVTLWVIVSQLNQTGDAPVENNLFPWSQPATPSSITSWGEFDTDGTDAFLWCHHIKGEGPPNSYVTQNEGGVSGNQQSGVAGTSDSTALVCRKFFVTQEWQPDVTIRVKRRLRKDEGIALLMTPDTPVAPNSAIKLDVRSRSLVRRGL